MTNRREEPYITVSWLKKIIVGDQTCEWASWFKAHHMRYPKMPSSFDLSVWKMDHTALITEIRKTAEENGEDAWVEQQNAFYLRGKSGITLAGTPDVITFTRGAQITGGSGIVWDAKTGNPNAHDIAQVMIYMWALPLALPQYKGTTFNGSVVYRTHVIPIPASAIDEPFRARLTSLIKKIGGEAPAPKVPSPGECRFCEITKEDCPQRMEIDTAAQRGDTEEF